MCIRQLKFSALSILNMQTAIISCYLNKQKHITKIVIEHSFLINNKI
jgi:hypothetical protein